MNSTRNIIIENKVYYLSITVIILLFITLEYFLIHKGFYAISADESGHTLDAYYWYIGQGNLFSIWLPFQKIIYAVAFYIHQDLLYTPRVISILFGLFTLITLIDFTFQIFHNQFIVLITCILGALFLPISIFSVLPLEEIYFFFFTIISLNFLFRWINTNKNIYLWLSVILSCINTTTRYEAWLFTFIIFTIISFRIIKENKSRVEKIFFILVIALILSAFPIFWICLSYINTGRFTGFINSVVQRYGFPPLMLRIKNNVLFNFISVNVKSLNILGVIFLFSLFKKNTIIKYFTFLFGSTLIIFSITTFLMNAMPTHNFWRLAMIWSLLLLPFTSYFIYFFIEKGSQKKIYYIGFVTVFCILAFLFTKQTIIHSSYSYITKDDVSAGQLLEGLLKDNNYKVYINSYNSWDRSSIEVASQFPERFVTNLSRYYNGIGLNINISQKLISELKEMNIHYFVLKPYYKLEGKNLLVVKKFKMWDIFKVPN